VVSSQFLGELCAGLSARPVRARILVSEESGQGSDSPAAAHSRSGACSPPIRLFAHLGLTAAGRVGGQPETGPAMVSFRRAPVAHAGAPTKAHSPASRAGSRASWPTGTVEYGFRA
jgi:hypothetical protein